MILQRNTLDSSLYDLGKVVTSDNFVTLLEYGLEQEKKKAKLTQEERTHEKEVNQQNIDALQAATDKANQREDRNKQLDRDSAEYQTEVKARAVLADSNVNTDTLDKFFDKEKLEQSERDNKIKNDMKQQEVDLKTEKQTSDISSSMTNLDLQFLKLKEDAKDRVARRQQSKDNVTIARVNT